METLIDPLQKNVYFTPGDTLTTTKAESDEGKLKFITRISFQETPIDASQAKWTQVVRLLLFWTMPGTLTTPRIIFQALHLHYYLGGMKMKDKPVIQPGTIPRQATETERQVSYHNFLLSLRARQSTSWDCLRAQLNSRWQGSGARLPPVA